MLAAESLRTCDVARTAAPERPLRVLHVVGGMEPGGIETWLMHVLRHHDRARVRMDFLVHTDRECAYDAEVLALGSKILPCLSPQRPWSYARDFRRILREHGPYDVVHSHVFQYSGQVLRLARREGVPVRIAHSHTDPTPRLAGAGLLRRGYATLMQQWIRRYATLGLADCRVAAAALFGPDWERDPRWRVLHCSVDMTPFHAPVNSARLRAELGIPEDAFVVGHVGRFCDMKNHEFLVDIAVEVAKRNPKMHLLMVGDGPLRGAIEQKVARLGLQSRTTIPGLRWDVPAIMMGAMDVVVLPSIWETIPVVGIEAQAAGRPFVCSEIVPEEMDTAEPLIRRLSLEQPASVWADAVIEASSAVRAMPRERALALMERSSFNIRTNVEELESLYEA